MIHMLHVEIPIYIGGEGKFLFIPDPENVTPDQAKRFCHTLYELAVESGIKPIG